MNYHDLLLLVEQIIFSHLAYNKGRFTWLVHYRCLSSVETTI